MRQFALLFTATASLAVSSFMLEPHALIAFLLGMLL